ncbi:GNAT family N-acetyltransferase [Mesorhizobium sp. 1M-11]|uniref:GNAT family N-acetyltransferase n=1 Tax=Mesorhizobium sp. 1M-11 TaxID=1529006 RepID=UPI0006C77217|nr:GNAT family N-acetyltransferase [Mesorhizobium sp. 1M-11]
MTDITLPTIVPMAEAHIEGFHHALDTVARERKYLAFLEAPPLPGTRDFVRGMIEKRNPQFVAVVQDEVVGWCDISRHERPVHAHRGTLGMGIIPAYRGHGLGQQLIETTLEEARRQGIVRVELSAYADNARAIALYRKVGFVQEGVERDAACIDGRYLDMVIMATIDKANRDAWQTLA